MPIPTNEERVGTLLGGKYRLGKLLGRGGMGAVFAGVHEWTSRPVAIKILNHEHVENPEAAERFLREARVVAGLKHPNVVDVLDMGEEPDRTVYMVLEQLEGDVLSKLLQREKTLSFERAADLLLPVMRAVAYAHTRNVVHRDIKPENIFLHRDPEGYIVPKILDFGIAKALDDERDQNVTQTGFVMGTPAYMSPEQGEGIPSRIGPPSDVWSMGVVWYECLAGALPFEGPTPTAILLAVNAGKFTRLVKRLPSLPVALANAIDKAIVRDVTRRYADMGAFVEAIQKAASEAGDPLPGRASSPSNPGAGRGSRERVSSSPWLLDAPDAAPVAPRITNVDSPVQTAELGPVGPPASDDEVTLGETTDDPVVLLVNPRRKRGPRVLVATAVASLVSLGVAAAWITRDHAPPPAAPRAPITPPADAAVTPSAPPSAPPPEPVVTAPADAASVDTAAPAAAIRHGRRPSRGHADDDTPRSPAVEPIAPTPVPPAPPAPQLTPPVSPPPVSPPPALPSQAPAPEPASQPDASAPHRGPHGSPTIPGENAPITDYDHAP